MKQEPIAAGVRPKRYVIVLKDGGETHSETDDIEKAKHTARSLGNWNHATEVFDRDTQTIVFEGRCYSDQTHR